MRVLLPLLLVSVSSAVFANDEALRRCRGIADASARLACYDAVPIGEAAPAARSAAPAGAATAAATGASTVPAAATAPAPEQRFGMEQRLDKSTAVDAIESHIPGRFEGWTANTKITLANGQVWQISDRSTGVYDLVNPKVRVRRGMLGSFFLELEGVNRSPQVKRVQ